MAHQAAEEAAQAGGRETTRDVERGDGRVAQIEAREVRAGAADDVIAELGVPTDPADPIGEEVERRVIGVDDVEHAGAGAEPVHIPPRASAARRLYRL